MTEKRALGDKGEQIAEVYLRANGYRILGRNVRLKRDEIDIIAYDPTHRMIVFVEVKTRTHTSEAYPIRTALNRRKLHALRRGITAWTQKQNYRGSARIDLICIHGDRICDHAMDIGAVFL